MTKDQTNQSSQAVEQEKELSDWHRNFRFFKEKLHNWKLDPTEHVIAHLAGVFADRIRENESQAILAERSRVVKATLSHLFNGDYLRTGFSIKEINEKELHDIFLEELLEALKKA